MSAIGDYVHLTYSGYVKGPELGSGKPPFFSSYGSMISNREHHFNQWVKKQESQVIKKLEEELQSSLNLLKNFKDNKGNVSQVENDKIGMALLNDLWNELDTKYLNVDKVAAAASGLLNESGFGAGRNLGKKNNKTEAQAKVITNINQEIQILLDNTLMDINNEASKILIDNNLSLIKLSKSVATTQNKINNFINNLQSKLKVLDTSSEKNTAQEINRLFNDLKNTIQNNKNLNSMIDIEGKLNALAKGLSGGLQSKQYKGDISEALTTVIGKRLTGVAIDGVNTRIKEAIVSGQERSSRGIVTGNFTSDIDWNQVLIGEKFKKPYGEYIVSADAVQDKVDIKIELEDGNHAYISAKNYNMKSLESGVKNTSASFLTLIQNENKESNLVNHYLNLNAVTGRGRQSLRPAIIEINDFIRKITIAKLITGYNTITDNKGGTMAEANVFAVFNSDKYTVKLYNMKDVLEGIFNSGRYKRMFIPSYFWKQNIKTPNYMTRISNIVKQLNVSVSYTLKEEEYANKR